MCSTFLFHRELTQVFFLSSHVDRSPSAHAQLYGRSDVVLFPRIQRRLKLYKGVNSKNSTAKSALGCHSQSTLRIFSSGHSGVCHDVVGVSQVQCEMPLQEDSL